MQLKFGSSLHLDRPQLRWALENVTFKTQKDFNNKNSFLEMNMCMKMLIASILWKWYTIVMLTMQK